MCVCVFVCDFHSSRFHERTGRQHNGAICTNGSQMLFAQRCLRSPAQTKGRTPYKLDVNVLKSGR